MNQITSLEFQRAVEMDPDWASRLTEPVEVADFCSMAYSEITHLSPLLHFAGKNEAGECADFSFCEALKVAEGKFSGFVYFAGAGIEKIGDLSCGKDNKRNSASFSGCKSLKVAEGNFEGFANFWGSSIGKIGDISCGKNRRGMRLNVGNCPNLTKIPLTFNPKEIEGCQKLIKKLKKDRLTETARKHFRTRIIEI